MADKPTYLTREGRVKLEAELDELSTVERKGVAERIAAAKELGDISESGEYEDAKKSQAILEGRIRELRNLLSRAETIDEEQVSNGEVRVGSQVTVRFEDDGEEQTWMIVGSAEANPRQGRISNESPIGSAILGKRSRHKLTVQTPSGVMKLTIVKVK